MLGGSAILRPSLAARRSFAEPNREFLVTADLVHAHADLARIAVAGTGASTYGILHGDRLPGGSGFDGASAEDDAECNDHDPHGLGITRQ